MSKCVNMLYIQIVPIYCIPDDRNIHVLFEFERFTIYHLSLDWKTFIKTFMGTKHMGIGTSQRNKSVCFINTETVSCRGAYALMT